MKFNRSDFSSLLAVLISLGALGVSLYEARLMQKQQLILQEQQKASVWPYLESETLFLSNSEETKIVFSLINKGVGPARISDYQLVIQGEEISSYAEVLELIVKTLKDDSQGLGIPNISIDFGAIQGILSPLEKYTYLEVVIPRSDRSQDKKLSQILHKSQTTVCYCSIYNDCWTLKTEPDTLTEGCQID